MKKVRITLSRRRTRLKGLPHSFTLNQWKTCLKHFNFSCSYCGMSEEEHFQKFNERLHQEHFIPLSKGGEYTHNNIIPACRSCNGGKMDRDFFEWYQQQEFYSKERENKILEYLNYQCEGVRQLALY